MPAFLISVKNCFTLSVSSVNSVAATLSLNIFWMRMVSLSAAEVMMTLALSRFDTKGRDFVIMTILCAMCAAVQASQKCSHCGQPFQHDTAEITLIGDLMLHPDCFK